MYQRYDGLLSSSYNYGSLYWRRSQSRRHSVSKNSTAEPQCMVPQRDMICYLVYSVLGTRLDPSIPARCVRGLVTKGKVKMPRGWRWAFNSSGRNAVSP